MKQTKAGPYSDLRTNIRQSFRKQFSRYLCSGPDSKHVQYGQTLASNLEN